MNVKTTSERQDTNQPDRITLLAQMGVLANDRCGRIVTLLESYMRRLEGLRKRYYRGALRISSFDRAYSARERALTGAKKSSPMTTWTMRTACGAICLGRIPTMGEPTKASPARLPWGLLQICRDCQNSCVLLTCAFFFWHSWADKMRCTCFIWRCFQRQFYRWTPKLRS